MARDLRDQVRALLARGFAPGEHKKAALQREQELAENNFENIAQEWHAKFSERWEPKNAKKIMTRMEKDIFPFIGFVPISGHGKYLFPSVRTDERPMSDNTVNAALRHMGYTKEEMTSHGFRSMASTLLNEQGWNRDAFERQLAHAERNKVRASYNFAEFLPGRRKMMQAWADYLNELRQGKRATRRFEIMKDTFKWTKCWKPSVFACEKFSELITRQCAASSKMK